MDSIDSYLIFIFDIFFYLEKEEYFSTIYLYGEHLIPSKQQIWGSETLEKDLEMQIYMEILSAYEDQQFDKGFEEKELIKLMNLLKSNQYDQKMLDQIVNNSIILILVLFFQKNSQNLYEKHDFTPKELDRIKKVFINSLNGDLTSYMPGPF